MKQWVMPAVFAVSLCISLAAATFGAGALGILLALILPASAWYLLERQNATRIWFLSVLLIAMFAIVAIFPTIRMGLTSNGNVSGFISLPDGLKKFSSHDELENFVMSMSGESYYGYYSESLVMPASAPAPASITWGAGANRTESDYGFTIGDDYEYTIDGQTPDYSTTNIQVEGVDEADIVKTDGEYIYVVSGDNVFIIDAYPAEGARILSKIELNETPIEIFINGDKLTVIGSRYLKVYDVGNGENPILKRDVSFDGNYFNSRMIGDYVYVIINSPAVYDWVGRVTLTVPYLSSISRVNLPDISCNGKVKTIPADEIYYFDDMSGYSYEFTTVMAINSQNDDAEINSKTFLISTAQNIFVSTTNIYITYTDYQVHIMAAIWPRSSDWTEKTIIHKIGIGGGEIEYKARGEVPGQVLNQFSMDEYSGKFRMATTTGWYGANHVYVLDEDLDIVGRLENIAPGERIYSARFMGNRAYLVTFIKTDPLFVIDLSNPTNPTILGELEIPGYSDYLHPYDETHLIGVGKDTTESDWGNFAWYQGVKIALFDVSDPNNPREISNYIVGQRGTDSLALHDHRAFLFSKSRNLLVMPIGDWCEQDAYVFDVSLDGGIALRGTISHSENTDYWNGTWYSVKRSLYIENTLYTVSDGLLKMNDLADLSEMNSVQLSQPVEPYWGYCEATVW